MWLTEVDPLSYSLMLNRFAMDEPHTLFCLLDGEEENEYHNIDMWCQLIKASFVICDQINKLERLVRQAF
jgi:hypothetical protein